MPLLLEPTAHEIKEEKLYAEMGLTDEEFNKIERLLGRTPNYTETGIFLLCGVNIVAIKIQASIKQIPN